MPSKEEEKARKKMNKTEIFVSGFFNAVKG